MAHAEIVEQQARDSFRHSRTLQSLAAATVFTLAAIGCGSSEPLQVSADQSTVIAPGHAEGPAPSEQTTQAPDTSQPDETTAPATTSSSPARDNPDIDFANFTYTINACFDQSLPWPTKLTNGSATKRTATDELSVSVSGDIAYGDVTGDQVDEAIIPLLCDNGRSQLHAIQVYDTSADKPKLLGILGDQSGEETRQIAPEKLSVEAGQIVVEEAWFAENDAPCCPTDKAKVHWVWSSGKFLKGYVDIERAPKQGVDQRQDEISINGIGNIGMGMSANDLRALGYYTTYECGGSAVVKGAFGKVYVSFEDNKIATIQTNDPKYVTSSGIRNGSTRQQVLSTYQGNTDTIHIETDTGPFEVIRLKSTPFINANKSLLFVIDKNGKVITITETKKDYGPIEGCIK